MGAMRGGMVSASVALGVLVPACGPSGAADGGGAGTDGGSMTATQSGTGPGGSSATSGGDGATEPDPDPDPDDDTAGQECDEECPEGYECDESIGECEPIPVCEDDLDCDPAGNGVCVFEDEYPFCVLDVKPLGSCGSRPTMVESAHSLTAQPRVLTSLDADGDGHVDVAVALESGEIEVLLGTGAGALTNGGTFASGTTEPRDIVGGDFDGDGATDLGLGSSDPPDDFVFVPGLGDGTFGPPVSVDINWDVRDLTVQITSGGATSLIGLVDPPYSDAAAYVIEVDPAGTPAKVAEVPLSRSATDLDATDLDGDDIVDLAVVGADELTMWRGLDGQDFLRQERFYVPVGGRATTFADLDGNGAADLAMLLELGIVMVRPGEGSFDFEPALKFRVPDEEMNPLDSADVDGDGTADVLGAYRAVYVLFGSSTATLSCCASYGTQNQPMRSFQDVAALDLDEDGRIDLVAADARGNELVVLVQSP